MKIFEKLLHENPDVAQRYLFNIKSIQDLDPFTLTIDDLDYSLNSIPPVTYPDIFSYLVLTHTLYSHEQMKAYKGLEAHKYFSAGFVQEVGSKFVNSFYVMVGKVKHSQKANAKPLDSWCIIMKDGTVSNGHCTCMAGNSKVCSHIGTLLFCAEYANSNKTTISCTDIAALWLMPSLSTELPIVPISKMDFGSATTVSSRQKGNMLTECVESLLNKIEDLGRSASIMRIVEPFASTLQSKSYNILPYVLRTFRCICKGVDDGSPIICCDNDQCQIKWFHFKCVRLSLSVVHSSFAIPADFNRK